MGSFTKPFRRLAVDTHPTCYGLVLSGWLAGALFAGEAVAAECRVSLSQPVVDFGQWRAGAALGAQGISMGKRTVRLNVACPEAAVIALRFQGAPADGQGYQFGRRGYFTLTLQQPLLDGKPVELASLLRPAERGDVLWPGQSLVALVGGRPATGRTFSAYVQVDTWLSNTAIAVRDKTLLEGGGHFELVPAG